MRAWHRIIGWWACVCLGLAPTTVQALSLDLPAQAVQTESVQDPAAPFGVATGPASKDGTVPTLQMTGPRNRTAWRMVGASEDAAVLFDDLLGQIGAAGYSPLFHCETNSCGGFDFRQSLPALAMPSMFVDLGDYMYASAALAGGDADAAPVALISILISRSSAATFVQVTEIAALPPLDTAQQSRQEPQAGQASSDAARIGAALLTSGHAVLDDVAFQTGSAQLAEGADRVAQLQSLADFLTQEPARRIMLVGHSDWAGGLDTNIALSRARAASVAAVLHNTYGVAQDQIAVEGIGFLSPRQANTDDGGRQANRRVEAVLLPDAP
ncbi:hypothetical protein BV911_11710 [Pseudoruegeria sp. SK021]|nr:hypothetical protein BV911_11710 [Pseudoruegeria sp. SK021]